MKRFPIYVIDDDQAMLASAKFLLQSFGLSPKTFRSPVDFLASADSMAPGCILTDIQMQGMSGLELQSQLLDRSIRWPVIFMSGQFEASAAQTALSKGAVDIIDKPFTGDRLKRALDKAFSILEAQRGSPDA